MRRSSGEGVKGIVEYRSPGGARICRESPLMPSERPKLGVGVQGVVFSPAPLPSGERGGLGAAPPRCCSFQNSMPRRGGLLGVGLWLLRRPF